MSNIPDMPIPTDTPSMLRNAAQLMKNGDKDGAKRIVAGVLKATQDNPDAWYLYAVLVDDPDKKTKALQRALAINPQHTRAQQLMANLSAGSDPFGDLLPNVVTASYGASAPGQQPVVYVNVHQANNNVQQVGVGLKTTNTLALVIGFIAAGFFGIFGLGHLFNGKIGGAIGTFFMGVIWIIIAGIMATVTLGFGLLILVPLHFYLAWSTSKRGATSIG